MSIFLEYPHIVHPITLEGQEFQRVLIVIIQAGPLIVNLVLAMNIRGFHRSGILHVACQAAVYE